MATVNPTSGMVRQDYNARLHTWTPLANGDVGAPIGYEASADRAVHVLGTFGAGGTVVIEGSMDGSDFQTLTDPYGVPLTFTSGKIKAVTELTAYIRPRVSAGDGTTAITVHLITRAQP